LFFEVAVMTTPAVNAARYGQTLARLRRFQNIATSEDAAWPSTTEFKDIGALSTAVYPKGVDTGIPEELGETWFGGINTTSGGTMILNVPSEVKFGANWVSSLTFTGAGSWAFLIAITYNDNLRWAVLNSSGVT
jgi:hypothetical protein